MNQTVNSNNIVIGYFDDEITLVEREDGKVFYTPVTKGLYPIGTTVNDDELFSIECLPITIQNKIKRFMEEENE